MTPIGQPFLVIVTGPPASGKTTIARQIARSIDIPAFHKDDFKERLADELPGTGLGWSQQLGRTSYSMLYLTAKVLLESGCSCMLEANFHPQLSLVNLVEITGDVDVVQVVCGGDPDVLLRRYLDRHVDSKRHPVHLDSDERRLSALESDFRRDHRLDLPGAVYLCDTTLPDPVDVERLVSEIKAKLSG